MKLATCLTTTRNYARSTLTIEGKIRGKGPMTVLWQKRFTPEQGELDSAHPVVQEMRNELIRLGASIGVAATM